MPKQNVEQESHFLQASFAAVSIALIVALCVCGHQQINHTKSFYVSCVNKNTFAVFLETDGADVQVSSEIYSVSDAQKLRDKLQDAMWMHKSESVCIEQVKHGEYSLGSGQQVINCSTEQDYIAGTYFNNAGTTKCSQ